MVLAWYYKAGHNRRWRRKLLFTARRYAKRGICRRHICVCVCVCVCVCAILRYYIKTAKVRITQIMQHNSPGILVFWRQRSLKLDWGHLRERQMQVGWVKIGHFRQITCYNSKTVQDRCIVSIKVVCALSNGYVANDLRGPLSPITTQFLHFCHLSYLCSE